MVNEARSRAATQAGTSLKAEADVPFAAFRAATGNSLPHSRDTGGPLGQA
jgi:hypothetical protein